MVSLSQKNQKFLDGYFQDSIFSKLAPHTSSDQTKPNQPMWYTTICSASCESIPKNLSSLGPMGAEIQGPESSKFEKQKI